MKTRIAPVLITIWLILLSVQSLAAQPAVPEDAGLQAALGSAFTYQGFLTDTNGNPANGGYDFSFRLFDALTGGNQVGSSFNLTNVGVDKGQFIVTLDFGANAFNGEARFLEILLRPASTGDYTTLSPRQPLSATPYALYSSSTGGLQGRPVGAGAPAANQVLKWDGSQWVPGNDAGGASYSAGRGLVLVGSQFNVAVPLNLSGSVTDAAVIAGTNTANGTGVYGSGPTGMIGISPADNGTGIFGQATEGVNPYGVWGQSATGTYWYVTTRPVGALGSSTDGIGVYGSSNSYVGVYGFTNNTDGVAVYGTANGTAGYAGYFNGKVHVNGTLSASTKQFKIDSPLDPANKYLYHTSVESADMKNIYDGIATLDANGEAVVQLPNWFQALNKEFRYQLTCIGGFAQVYIAKEIQDNHFTIGGGRPGMKISWQVTGIRHDPYSEQHRSQVEVDKPPQERGTYLYPQGYGQPASMGLDSAQQNVREDAAHGPVR